MLNSPHKNHRRVPLSSPSRMYQCLPIQTAEEILFKNVQIQICSNYLRYIEKLNSTTSKTCLNNFVITNKILSCRGPSSLGHLHLLLTWGIQQRMNCISPFWIYYITLVRPPQMSPPAPIFAILRPSLPW